MKHAQPKNPFHPGEILLEEFLEPMGKTQSSFAEELGWTKAKLNELIKGKRGITADTAIDLSETLGTSPKLWMNLQSTWDLNQAMKSRSASDSASRLMCGEMTGPYFKNRPLILCGKHNLYHFRIFRRSPSQDVNFSFYTLEPILKNSN